ncbi:MAG: hypothetical protein MJE77_20035, partial [Proteobacteria bacterium]|nr:hypothetical protein [Pseudomonadota bacterium]
MVAEAASIAPITRARCAVCRTHMSKCSAGDSVFAAPRDGYDPFGNLDQVQLPDGTVIDYILDGQQRRIGKKVNGALESGFLYQDDLNPVAQLDASGNVIARFVYAEQGHVPAYMTR